MTALYIMRVEYVYIYKLKQVKKIQADRESEIVSTKLLIVIDL